MTVETAIYTRATTHAGLSALITGRAHFKRAPQKQTLPYVVFARVSTNRPSAMGADAGIARARFQFDGWSDTADGARALGEQIRSAFQRWSTTTGASVQDSFVLNDFDGFDEDADEDGLHRATLDFEIIYEE